MTYQTHQLIQIGGRKWQEGAFNRVYFNTTHEVIGLEITRWGGKIDRANLNGEVLSKGEAKSILGGKVFYDLDSGEFGSKDIKKALADVIIANIQKALEPVEQPKVIYNKSLVMKRAWELRREGMTASAAMKQAWAEHKAGQF